MGWGVADPFIMCSDVKSGSSASRDVCIGRREPAKLKFGRVWAPPSYGSGVADLL